MADRTLLVLAAVLEVSAGLVLFLSPSVFVHLLLGADVVETGSILGRVAGFGLLSLGIACWPGADIGTPSPILTSDADVQLAGGGLPC
jgi:hypothetical protein